MKLNWCWLNICCLFDVMIKKVWLVSVFKCLLFKISNICMYIDI